MRSLLPYLVIVIVLSSLGCANEVPSVDVEAERTALLEANRAWAAAAAAGDVARIISFWADDAISYFPGAPVAQGKEVIGELVRENRSQPAPCEL